MKGWLRAISALAIVSGAGVFAYLFSTLLTVQDPPLSYGLLYVAGYVAALALAPGIPYIIGGAILFGPFWGSLFSLLGLSLGSTLLSIVVRLGFRETMKSWDRKGRLSRMDPNARTVLRWRLMFLPHTPLNLAVGAGTLHFGLFLLLNLASFIPSVVLYSLLGASLRKWAQEHPVWMGAILLGSVIGFAVLGLTRQKAARRVLATQMINQEDEGSAP